MAGRRGWREFLFHGIALLGLLLIFAAAIEIYVRTVADDGMQFDLEMWKYALALKQASPDPLLGHVHRPDSGAHLMGVDVRTNALGYRDHPMSRARKPGTVRILMLGDSFTEGWGVPLEATFSKRVERSLNQAGVKAEVINAGVGNYNTIQAVQLLLTEGHKVDPDIVVLNFTYNDAEPVPQTSAPGLLKRHCYACTYFSGRIDALMRLFNLRQPWGSYYLGLFEEGRARGWLDARDALARLGAFCRQRNIGLLIANYPELHDTREYQFGAITALIRRAAEEEGARFVDLLPAVAHEDPATLWVTPEDVHPNARANELFAAVLFRELRELMAARRPVQSD